jgi:Ca2+-binding RTX toxin-like protein
MLRDNHIAGRRQQHLLGRQKDSFPDQFQTVAATAPSYASMVTSQVGNPSYWQTVQEGYTVAAGASAYERLFGDFDHDGDIDILLTLAKYPPEDTGVPMQLLLNDGAGNFTDGTSAYFPGGAPSTIHPRGIVVADFNGDGFSDVFIADHGMDAAPNPGAQNTLLLSGANGHLANATATLPQVRDFSHSATAGDIDGDGDQDLIVMNTYGGTPGSGPATAPYVLLNDGSAGFTRVDNHLPTEIRDRQSAYTSSLLFDANGDGHLDLFLGTHGESSTASSRILINPGNGDFSAATQWLLPSNPWGNVSGQTAVAVVAGDLNGDGLTDLVVTITRDYQNSYVQILINRGGSFVDETSSRFSQDQNSSGWIVRCQLADVNGDGALDILVQNKLLSPLFVNDGTGHFVQMPASFFNYGGWGSPQDLSHYATDVNGDGRTDVVADSGGGQLWVFIQQDQGTDIVGTSAADGLLGDASDETFHAGDGDDVVHGAAGNDRIFGEDGNDQLIGGPGVDVLEGGAGNDIYFVDDSRDVAIEGIGAGNDKILTSVSYALAANAEVEILSAADNNAPTAIDLSGNAFSNQLWGTNGANVLTGGGGSDHLVGFGGDDTLIGNSDAASTLEGGAGNDTYYVHRTGDSLIEAGGGGNDRVVTSVSYTLSAGQEIETLVTIDAAAIAAIDLAGNALSQVIFGNAGANTLTSGGGADYMIALGGNDILFGNAGAASTLQGGTGNDTYYIFQTGDSLVEFTGEGNDQIVSTVSYTLSAGQEVENLFAADPSGTAAVDLAGNALSQNIFGNAGANSLTGGGGVDLLVGGGGDDTLFGNADAASTLQGGTGNDVYYILQTGDSLVEFAGEGNDRIVTTVSYTLSAGVEVETLAAANQPGTAAIDLTGNEIAQIILGTNGANTLSGGDGADQLVGFGGNDILLGGSGGDLLNGGAGSDVLNGGQGADLFVFADALGATNVDAIQDFATGADKISLDHGIFTGLSTGALAAGALAIGTAAQDADDRIIYDSTTGNLYYDADGNGAGAAVLFATLSGHPALAASDIVVA